LFIVLNQDSQDFRIIRIAGYNPGNLLILKIPVQTDEMANKMNISNHPCFNDKVRHTFGRVHLPVAPRCNIQWRSGFWEKGCRRN